MELAITLTVAPENVRAARRALESLARDHGYAEARVNDLSLAFAEACFNAIDHGGCCADLRWSLALERGTLEVAVENAAPAAAAGPAAGGSGASGAEAEQRLRDALGRDEAAPDPERERGRGLQLMRARVDDVRVVRRGDDALAVVLVLRR